LKLELVRLAAENNMLRDAAGGGLATAASAAMDAQVGEEIGVGLPCELPCHGMDVSLSSP
jgi:hypothetical protein